MAPTFGMNGSSENPLQPPAWLLKRPRATTRTSTIKTCFPRLAVPRRLVWLALIFVGIASQSSAHAADWTDPVEVRQEAKRCVSYRARLDGQFLVVEASHEEGWHTYAMDNTQRAQEKLAGRKSLGIDRPTEIGL